jgi:hypothetical protein
MWKPPSRVTARAIRRPTTTARLRILSRCRKKVERPVGPSFLFGRVARSRVQGRAKLKCTRLEALVDCS